MYDVAGHTSPVTVTDGITGIVNNDVGFTAVPSLDAMLELDNMSVMCLQKPLRVVPLSIRWSYVLSMS